MNSVPERSRTLAIVLACVVLGTLLGGIGLLTGWFDADHASPSDTIAPIAGEDARAGELAGLGAKAPVAKTEPVDSRLLSPIDFASVDRDRDLHGVVVVKDDGSIEGSPIAGAIIQTLSYPWRAGNILDSDRYDEEVLGAKTTSARDGSFVIRMRTGTATTLRVSAEGFATTTESDAQAGARVRVELTPSVASTGSASLTVMAQEPDGTPVPDASVNVRRRRSGSQSRAGTTDADGHASFEALPAGVPLRIETARTDEGGGSHDSTVTLVAGKQTKHVATLPRGLTIHGTVTDAATGRPVANARVGMGWTMHKEARTDAQGKYALGGWTGNGYHEVHVLADGYGREAKFVQMDAAIDIALTPAFTIEGRLVAPDGTPVPNARVAAVGSKRSERSRQIISMASGTTDGQGHFRLTDLRRDLAHTVAIMPKGLGRIAIDVPVAKDREATRSLGDIVVARGQVIRGRALDATGKGIANMNVSLSGPTGGDLVSSNHYGRIETRTTDDLGRFAFADQTTGRFVVTAGIHGQERVSAQTTVRRGEAPPPIDLKFEPRRSLRVEVRDTRGAPVANATVMVHGTGLRDLYEHTDAEGAVTLRLPMTVTMLQIRVMQWGDDTTLLDGAEATVRADAGTHNVVLNDGARLRGRLLDGDGEPIPHAVIEVHRGDKSVARPHTDTDGAFSVALEPGAPVDIYFRGEVYVGALGSRERKRRRKSMEATQLNVPLTGPFVTLRATRSMTDQTLSVRVVDASGKPVVDATVLIEPAPIDGPTKATTTQDGQVKFSALARQPHTVFALPPKGQELKLAITKEGSVTPTGQTLTLQMLAPTLLRGVVVDIDGKPVANAGISSNHVFAGERPSTKTNDDGTFALPFPPDTDGPATIWASMKGDDGQFYACQIGGINPKQPEPLRFVLKPETGW